MCLESSVIFMDHPLEREERFLQNGGDMNMNRVEDYDAFIDSHTGILTFKGRLYIPVCTDIDELVKKKG